MKIVSNSSVLISLGKIGRTSILPPPFFIPYKRRGRL